MKIQYTVIIKLTTKMNSLLISNQVENIMREKIPFITAAE